MLALYPVPVRQLRVLPPASSPPHLAMTQLPLANGSGLPARIGLAPPRSVPCLAHVVDAGLRRHDGIAVPIGHCIGRLVQMRQLGVIPELA